MFVFVKISITFTTLLGELKTVQDLLCKLGMKPKMHVLESSIFFVYNIGIRLTKIINRADKKLGTFLVNKVQWNLDLREPNF